MCANCGFPLVPGHWTEAGVDTPHDKLRGRFRRARLLNAILGEYGLTAYDDGVTPGITIATKTGNQVIADDLAQVWEAAERLSGHRIDPLSDRFLRPDEEERSAAG